MTAVTSSPVVGIEGQSVTLQFTITEADPPVRVENIRWQFSTPLMDNPLDITNTSSNHYQLSDDRRALTVNQISTAQQGLYTLFATNEAGVRSSSIRLLLEGAYKPMIFTRHEVSFILIILYW